MTKKIFVNGVANFVIVSALLVVVIFAFSQNSIFAAATELQGVIYSGDRSERKVALNINVGNEFDNIETVLNSLEENNVKATFFLSGSFALKNTESVQRILEDEHEIGNLGFNYRDYKNLSIQECKEEISSNHNLIKQNFNVDMKFFSPPFGSLSKNTASAANELNYRTIMFSKTASDLTQSNINTVINKITKSPSNGDIYQFYMSDALNSALPVFIKNIKNKGFSFSLLSELL